MISGAGRAELRAAAEKATPGPWAYVGSTIWHGVTADELGQADALCQEGDEVAGNEIYDRGGFVFAGDPERDEDGEFVAAANPAAVLSLLDDADRLAAVEADRDRVRALLNERYAPAGDAEMDDILRRAEKRIRNRTWRLVAYVVRKWAVERAERDEARAQLADARADADSWHAQSVRIHKALDAQLAERDRVLDRVRTHSKAVRMIVDDAESWVRTGGEQGRRFGEPAASRLSSPDTTEATTAPAALSDLPPDLDNLSKGWTR